MDRVFADLLRLQSQQVQIPGSAGIIQPNFDPALVFQHQFRFAPGRDQGADRVLGEEVGFISSENSAETSYSGLRKIDSSAGAWAPWVCGILVGANSGAMVGVGVFPEMELSTPQAVNPKRAKRTQATGDHRRLDGNFRCILLLGILFIGVPAMSGGSGAGRARSLGASILGRSMGRNARPRSQVTRRKGHSSSLSNIISAMVQSTCQLLALV